MGTAAVVDDGQAAPYVKGQIAASDCRQRATGLHPADDDSIVARAERGASRESKPLALPIVP